MRLFVALLLSEEVRNGLAAVQDELGVRCDGVRWVRPELLHLTVRFLGEVDDRAVAGVAEAMSRGAADAAPFDMRIAGLGAFPPAGAARIVWAGASDESGTMAAMERSVGANLDAAGFPPEFRAWSPHITLGRVRVGRSPRAGRASGSGRDLRAVLDDAEFPAMTQSAQALSLMSSVLGTNGSRYECVASARLGA